VILGWRRGNSVGRYVLVDTMWPWPSLHFGRDALRTWAARQNRLRNRPGDTGGPYKMPTGITTAVCEYGDVTLRIWPVGKLQEPRAWTDADAVWRDALAELRRFIGDDLKCCTRIEWMPGQSTVTRFKTVPELQGVPGFWGWRRGEREPTERIKQSLRRMAVIPRLGARVDGAQRLYLAS